MKEGHNLFLIIGPPFLFQFFSCLLYLAKNMLDSVNYYVKTDRYGSPSSKIPSENTTLQRSFGTTLGERVVELWNVISYSDLITMLATNSSPLHSLQKEVGLLRNKFGFSKSLEAGLAKVDVHSEKEINYIHKCQEKQRNVVSNLL